MTTPDTRDPARRELGLGEMLEAERQHILGNVQIDGDTLYAVSGNKHLALLDLAIAAERRRQAQIERRNKGGTGYSGAYSDAEWAEDAALDRLTEHLAGASDEERP